MSRATAIYLLPQPSFDLIYGPEERADIAQRVEVLDPLVVPDVMSKHVDQLAAAELIFSGWGAPKLDETLLASMPKLRAVFYGAGSIRGITTEAFWNRSIPITSAYAANAVPVAEYALATILLSLKRFWALSPSIRRNPSDQQVRSCPGAYRSTVGLVSLGMVGRRVRELLRSFDLRVIAYDPYLPAADAAALGVEPVGLDELFRRADVVSLHTPWIKETEGMITGAHFSAMKQGATFINTARGAVVSEPGMIAVLQQRPDLTAILDVTHPEPPVSGSPLYTLPNVILTPHIAGSMFTECRRMGRYMVEELDRFLAGQPLRWGISREKSRVLA
jgi:phosphoglycerate dehydrogenase-like enzyme